MSGAGDDDVVDPSTPAPSDLPEAEPEVSAELDMAASAELDMAASAELDAVASAELARDTILRASAEVQGLMGAYRLGLAAPASPVAPDPRQRHLEAWRAFNDDMIRLARVSAEAWSETARALERTAELFSVPSEVLPPSGPSPVAMMASAELADPEVLRRLDDIHQLLSRLAPSAELELLDRLQPSAELAGG